jgi:hypothetical protein
MGWGVLLWSTEDPPILSGTILPVYIKSNINQVYVVGVPEAKRRGAGDDGVDKIEIPLTQLEYTGSKRKAVHYSREFSTHAAAYAENLQDGLPIREQPDNNARRVYRLRVGEIIKILALVQGNPPVGASGDPLPGDWSKVLTQDGVTGYCFSYRLKMFDHFEGSVKPGGVTRIDDAMDPDLDLIFSNAWSPEYYLQMVNQKKINISELEKQYHFDPGHDTGIAKIVLNDMEREFTYESITSAGEDSRSWLFEGTSLQMELRSNTTLAVSFQESTGLRRSLIFNALPSDVDDIIIQENARRETLFRAIYNQGPKFTSNNYGSITFSQTGDFKWTGYDLLVPQLLPLHSTGEGHTSMDLFISPNFADRYIGALSFNFASPESYIHFMYSLDNQGLRLEVIPEFAIEDVTVTRRATSPMVLYFYKDSSSF